MSALGPRKVGGRYLCGYWREEYTVTAIEWQHGTAWITVEWTDGNTGTHCAPWDERRDRIMSEPGK